MKFHLSDCIKILSRTPKILSTLLIDLPDGWTSTNEGPDTWSPYDIIGHLIHGEQTDWIPRAKIILGNAANKTFEPFDRFAQFENSKGKTLIQLLDTFHSMRQANLEALNQMEINDEKLGRTGIHPALGEVTLQQLLATWTIHDLSHINQMTRVMAKQYKSEVGPWREYISIIP